MIIGFLTALTLALFVGGGQNSLFLDPNVEKDVKIYVTEKNRQKEIFDIIDVMKEDQKAFTKNKHNVYEKQAADLNKNYFAKRSEFNALSSQYLQGRVAIQDSMAKNEIRIRSIFTDQEWNAFIENIMSGFDKNEADSSFKQTNEKVFGKIEASCVKVISDPNASKRAVEAIESEKELVNQIIREYLNLDYYHAEKLRNKDASFEDFKVVSENINKLRFDILSHYFDLRFELIEDCTEKEWSKLSKEFTEVFIKGKGIKK